MGLEILDCTLRDGGYVNNWEFGRHAIRSILEKLDAGGLDIVECGFLTSHPRGEDCTLYASPRDITPLLPKHRRGALFVAMIALGERELSPDRLPPREEAGIGGIRLTFRREDASRAFTWAGAVQALGYQVFLQPVGTAFYSDLELLRLVEQVNRLEPFAFYIVDTLGSMYSGQVARQFHLIHQNMEPSIRLGFHGHNNLQLAFSNAQLLASIPSKRGLILDSSVYGMGRGAGNLPTELITRYVNQNIQSRYNVAMVMDIYDEYIACLRQEYQWGYSMAYHIAATHACHPNYAAYLLNKQTLTTQDVDAILQAIPREKRVEFDQEEIRRLYAQHQSRHLEDAPQVEELTGRFAGRKILVLAPGRTLRDRETQVLEFIRRENPVVLGVNFADPKFQVEVCFISSHKRLDIAGPQVAALSGVDLVLTSNLAPHGGKDALYVDYDRCRGEDPMVGDDAGLMLLKLLSRCGVKTVYLAGFDGFQEEAGKSYYSRASALPVNRAETAERRRRTAQQLQLLPVETHFLTPSVYQEVLS